MDLLEQNQDRDNVSLAAVQQAKISKDRILEFISQDQDLSEADIDQVLGAVGMSGAKLLDCEQLAAKLLVLHKDQLIGRAGRAEFTFLNLVQLPSCWLGETLHFSVDEMPAGHSINKSRHLLCANFPSVGSPFTFAFFLPVEGQRNGMSASLLGSEEDPMLIQMTFIAALLHSKHLLALLMRRDPSVWSLVPRSYILTRVPADAASEWKIFQRDYELSQCLGRLRNYLDAQAAALTPKPSQDDGLESTFDICKRHLGAHIADNHFWEGLHLSPMRKAEMLVRLVEQELPHLQLDLLQNNWWLAKPVDGAMGKGIILFGGLSCAEDLQVSTMPFWGRMSDGYVLQKYIEKPHLVHMPSLIDIDNRRGRHTAEACVDEFYKYNLRMLVLVRWVEDPSVWVYDKGYIDLCAMPFAAEYGAGVQEAHVSNLPCKGKGTGVRKRMWSTDTFRQYLHECAGRDVWAEEIVSQIRTAISRALNCLLPLTTGPGCGSRDDFNSTPPVRQPWRRFGFDFALGTNFHVWLVEVNHRPGMKAPKGPAGEDKRQLLEHFYADESELCGCGLQETRDGCSRQVANFHRVTVKQKRQRDLLLQESPVATGKPGEERSIKAPTANDESEIVRKSLAAYNKLQSNPESFWDLDAAGPEAEGASYGVSRGMMKNMRAAMKKRQAAGNQ
ncbi:TTLL3A [Symbiodinium sp. KB8]|nr:TTLL3A [Symbiodinium sp. KB8]